MVLAAINTAFAQESSETALLSSGALPTPLLLPLHLLLLMFAGWLSASASFMSPASLGNFGAAMTAVVTSLVKFPAVGQLGRRTCVIYALVNQREPSVWRYIGRTFRPEDRRFQHMDQSMRAQRGATGKGRWIRNLAAAGLRSSAVVLDSGISAREARAREQLWIRRALREGHPLTNGVRYCKRDC